MNLQEQLVMLELAAGGQGSGCNPAVAKPRCGRPRKGEAPSVSAPPRSTARETAREVSDKLRRGAEEKRETARKLQRELALASGEGLVSVEEDASGFLVGSFIWLSEAVASGALSPISVDTAIKAYREYEKENYDAALGWTAATAAAALIELAFLRRLGTLMAPMRPLAQRMGRMLRGPAKKISRPLLRQMARLNRQLMTRARRSPQLRRLFRLPIPRPPTRRRRRRGVVRLVR